MARLRRYELYEGDGEIIPGEYTPPEEREAGQKPPVRTQEPEPRNRYFAVREDDGLGAPSPLFDDFDRFSSRPEPDRRTRGKAPRHYDGGWIALIVCCLVILTGIGLLMVPQLTGVRYRFLPNIGFMNGSILVLDQSREEEHNRYREMIYTDRIYSDVIIDNRNVGGMTREAAIREVEGVNEQTDTKYKMTVNVGDKNWEVNSSNVPFSRNIRETVEKAWAYGRSNTAGNRGSGKTPFMERVENLMTRTQVQVYETRQDYDHQALRNVTDEIVKAVNREPVNSSVESFTFATKTFTFTDDVPGAKIDPDDLYLRLATILDGGPVNNLTVPVVPERVEAEMTKAELMNRFGLISAYTTNTTNNKNRNTNIQLSAAAINGITVQPGEIFSFNGATGERTAAKGYKEAAAISGGQSKDEIGGGVCQTSSTLFNAVARADLEIIERNPHAWPSNYVEKGFDATVNWPGLDFKFKNNTEWPIFIVAGYSNQKVTVNIYGMSLGAGVKIELESDLIRTIPKPEGINYVINTSLAPGERKKTITGREGYEVQTWKVWYQGNREIKREVLFKTTYKAYQETVEYNPQ